MLVARSFVHGNMYGVLHVASEHRALAVMIGSMGLEQWGSDSMSRLLVEAVGALSSSLDDGAPARLADALLSRLAVDGDPDDRPTWILYAAALVRPGAVEICHAGDLRIQLVQGAAVVHATIDHTLGNEGAPDSESYPLRNVVVRSLKRGDPPPDQAIWTLDGSARLLVVSSEVHGNGPREQPAVWAGFELADRYFTGAMIEMVIPAAQARAEQR
jgi:hypothetical protein